jgi:predicted metal-dependent hydrolase
MIERRITLADTQIDFKVARSKRRRTIGLKVAEDGLTVTLPTSLGLHHAERAVRDKQGWVLDRLEKMTARARPALQGVEGEFIGWLGDALPLRIVRHDRARTVIVRETDRIEARLDARLEPDMAAAALRRALHRWRKSEALSLMAPKVAAYADALDAKRPKVSVREQNRRWGSCSEDGSIRMNARLIAFPEPFRIAALTPQGASRLTPVETSGRTDHDPNPARGFLPRAALAALCVRRSEPAQGCLPPAGPGRDRFRHGQSGSAAGPAYHRQAGRSRR